MSRSSAVVTSAESRGRQDPSVRQRTCPQPGAHRSRAEHWRGIPHPPAGCLCRTYAYFRPCCSSLPLSSARALCHEDEVMIGWPRRGPSVATGRTPTAAPPSVHRSAGSGPGRGAPWLPAWQADCPLGRSLRPTWPSRVRRNSTVSHVSRVSHDSRASQDSQARQRQDSRARRNSRARRLPSAPGQPSDRDSRAPRFRRAGRPRRRPRPFFRLRPGSCRAPPGAPSGRGGRSRCWP